MSRSSSETAPGRAMRNLIVVVICLISISGCGKWIDTAEWTEEVRLSDGSIVQVWRQERRGHFGFPNAKRGGLVSSVLEYRPQKALWKNVFKESGRRGPISFDLFDGVPYLVVLVTNRAFCLSRPPDDYRAQVLRWQDGRWHEIPQSEALPPRAITDHAWSGLTGTSAQRYDCSA